MNNLNAQIFEKIAANIKGGVPKGTKTVTMISKFITYVVQLDSPRRILGWWEWHTSIKVDIGPPVNVHPAETAPALYHTAATGR